MLDNKKFNQAISEGSYDILDKTEVQLTLKAFPYFNVLEKTQNATPILHLNEDNKQNEEKVDYIYNDESHKLNARNMVYDNKDEKNLQVDMVMQSIYGNTSPVEDSTNEVENNTNSHDNLSDGSLGDSDTMNNVSKNDSGQEEGSLSASNIYDSPTDSEVDKSLTQNHSFSEWLKLIKNKSAEKEEQKQQVANIKAEWQKQKLQDVLQEDPEVIDDEVFDMVINSVTEDDEIISEPLAQLYVEQGYTEKAKEVYSKLILKYPEKSAYFADLISKLDT